MSVTLGIVRVFRLVSWECTMGNETDIKQDGSKDDEKANGQDKKKIPKIPIPMTEEDKVAFGRRGLTRSPPRKVEKPPEKLAEKPVDKEEDKEADKEVEKSAEMSAEMSAETLEEKLANGLEREPVISSKYGKTEMKGGWKKRGRTFSLPDVHKPEKESILMKLMFGEPQKPAERKKKRQESSGDESVEEQPKRAKEAQSSLIREATELKEMIKDLADVGARLKSLAVKHGNTQCDIKKAIEENERMTKTIDRKIRKWLVTAEKEIKEAEKLRNESYIPAYG